MPVTLLTIEEAALRYNITPKQLQSLVQDGTMEEVTVDGQSMIVDEELRKVAGTNGNHIQWISLQDAIAQFGFSEAMLKRLAKDGIIRSSTLEGTIQLAYNDIKPIARQLAPANFQHLEGIPIGVTKAAEKYGFSLSSVFEWAKKGHIEIIRADRKPVLLNEADVAYTRALANIRGMTAGRALFPNSNQYRRSYHTT